MREGTAKRAKMIEILGKENACHCTFLSERLLRIQRDYGKDCPVLLIRDGNEEIVV